MQLASDEGGIQNPTPLEATSVPTVTPVDSKDSVTTDSVVSTATPVSSKDLISTDSAVAGSTSRTNPYAGMTVAEIAAARKAKAATSASTAADRMAQLRSEREATALQRALSRAASSPLYNFTQRPEGYIDTNRGIIAYYGWTGGKTTGRWTLREAPLNDITYNNYYSRVPANTYVVKDIRSTPVPLMTIQGIRFDKDKKQIINISPKSQQAKLNGFSVSKDGKIVTYGNVDPNILNIKSQFDQKAMETMRTERDKTVLTRSLQRAKSDPKYNFLSRPAGRETDDKLYFYSWIGGKESGEWVLYEAANNDVNRAKYLTRIPATEYFEPTSMYDVLIPKVAPVSGVTNPYPYIK